MWIRRWKQGITVAVTTALLVMLVVIIRLGVIGGLLAFLAIDSAKASPEVDTDIAHYSQYMGEQALDEYQNKWGMKEDIFPEKITDEMDVLDYKMVYYNPWDAQYLSYLVVEYQDEDYQKEMKRLEAYPSTSYIGYYGVEGFENRYMLLAMEADSYQGFVYALAGSNNQIIYVELIFCNYFMDIDYQNEIPNEYLPIGFDATDDNAYREEKMK